MFLITLVCYKGKWQSLFIFRLLPQKALIHVGAFKYKRGQLLVLDQLKLPHIHEYLEVKSTEDGWQVINKMQVM